MADIDANLISREELVRLVREAQQAKIEAEEKLKKEKEEADNRINLLQKNIAEQRATLDSVRFPGISIEELPSLSEIAKQINTDQALLEFYLDKYPDKFLNLIDRTISGAISVLKQKIKDAEVDISGNSTIELMEDQEELFWSKYVDANSIDDKFTVNLIKAKESFFKMKKQYTEEKSYLADISNIQDCRMSAYLHFRKRQDASTELIAETPENKENEKVVELESKLETMQKEIESLKKGKEEKDFREVEKEAQVDQEKLASLGDGEVKPEESEEEIPEEVPSEDDKPKKGKKKG